VILADRGFAGRTFETFLDDLGIHVVRPARKNTPLNHHVLAGWST
jgi:hypothetical protein